MFDGEAASPARVTIVGGGFGGLAAARALRGKNVAVTVVDKHNYHLFQPLLYQVALAGLASSDVAVPIRAALARRHRGDNVRVMLGEVVGFDVDQRIARLRDGELGWDFLIVAAGASTNYYGHDDWRKLAPGLKDLDDALEIRRRVLSAMESAERSDDPDERTRLLTFVVIGGGPTGVELAGAIADLSRDILRKEYRVARPSETRVILLEMSERVLMPFTPHLSQRAAEQLRELRVEIRTNVRVNSIDADGVWLDGEFIPAATVLWGAGVRPSPLGRMLGAPVDRAGRVIVDADCSVPRHPNVFVIGDMASFVPEGSDRPLPGISPVAIQQGRAVADNILRTLRGQPRRPFVYFDKGFMATIGKARAVAMLRSLQLSGFVAWLTWVFVHLWYLVGFRNRIMVFLNWIWSYAMSKHGARLILGPPGIPSALESSVEAAPPARPPPTTSTTPSG